jgi:predicted aldo/keto reductase-like oxidoreductase
MDYRRFGSTNLNLSVVTLGGMRYPHGWTRPEELPVLPEDSLEACYQCTQRALDMGINHIETAHGYGISERLYGDTWSRLRQKREDFFLMTKGSPATYDEARSQIELQLKNLKTDRIDLYGWHGINTRERLGLATGGALAALRKFQEEGVIGHIGFSTHGPLDVILDAINTGEFAFVNLHYYYFFQRNLPAVVQAGLRDMGVFIISPNDKGGQLFYPSEPLKRICAPLTPIQFNARFCLSHPQIHTLTFGIDRPEYFDEAAGIPNNGYYLTPRDQRIRLELDRQIEVLGDSYCTGCYACLPCPEQINIPEILRFRNMWKAYGMETFGKYRYNMLEEHGHWFPGTYGSACTDCGDCLPRCPVKLNIPALLRETHAGLYIPKNQV